MRILRKLKGMSIMTETTVRQPRGGKPENKAQTAATEKHMAYVQLRTPAGAWKNVFELNAEKASAAAAALNSIFAIPGADLDFITPGYDPASKEYVVIWPGVRWDHHGPETTTTVEGSTKEDLYLGGKREKAGNLYVGSLVPNPGEKVIVRVAQSDLKGHNRDPWVIAFKWANAIRNCVNGWNCYKDATGTYKADHPMKEGFIYQLGEKYLDPNKDFPKWSGTSASIPATFFGAGEKLPYFTGAKGDEIFHTCDLTVGRPGKASSSTWPFNSWVKITYKDRSVVARVTDICDLPDGINLSSGGVAKALGFPGSGNVSVSAP